LSVLLRRESDMEVVGDVEDWRQALELARPLKPDVVLTDTSMPETVGVD